MVRCNAPKCTDESASHCAYCSSTKPLLRCSRHARSCKKCHARQKALVCCTACWITWSAEGTTPPLCPKHRALAKAKEAPVSPSVLAAKNSLQAFDDSPRFGPKFGITRMQRWQRAQRHNLAPPQELFALFQQQPALGNTPLAL